MGIDPFGMVIVKVPDFPFIVPDTVIVVPPWKPEKVTFPVNAFPVWVICQFIVPTDPIPMPEPMDMPIVVPLESEAAPDHVPVTADTVVVGVDVGVGLAGVTAEDPLQAAAVTAVKRVSDTIHVRIWSFLLVSRQPSAHTRCDSRSHPSVTKLNAARSPVPERAATDHPHNS
jgi:hypothetical protein